MQLPVAYIPIDRRQAIARGKELPGRTSGAALFADVSGFTPLTEALVRELGSKRGAEELTRHLNVVYSALIAEVHRYGGSVVSFAGDAITCWFDGDDGLRTTTCALSMQGAMGQFAEVKTRSGSSVPLAIKTSVSAGPVRRFLVGDPKIQLLDVVAGATLDRMARTDKHAQKNEVVLSSEVVSQLGDAVQILEWREDARAGERFAVVGGLAHVAETDRLSPLPDEAEDTLTEEQVRAWILPPIYSRLRTGQERYLAELRPAVAFFLKFGGLDYDRDDAVGAKLDAYVRWVQNVLARYESYLFQLITGDKGSYLYAAFGAPLSHGDDSARAVAVAMELRSPPPEMNYIGGVQIGIAQGQMRAGAYGSPTRHTYGVLGDEVTIAARLMGEAKPGEIWVSQFVADGAARDYRFEYLQTVPLKGTRKPMQVYRPLGRQSGVRQTAERTYRAPLVGRDDELAQVEQILEFVLEGKGQILRLEGGTGIGKSHLAAHLAELARDRGFEVATGICQSTGQGAAYSCWRSVFRSLLNLTDDPGGQNLLSWITGQVNHVQAVVSHTNPNLLTRLPLLGNLLELPIPDNPTTAALDPELRQQWLFALVIELLQSWTNPNPAGMQEGREGSGGKVFSDRLQQMLDANFSQGELRTLCYGLNLDYDSLAGEGKADKVSELIAHFERGKRIPELIKASRQLRPDIVWGPTPGARAKTARLPHPLLLLVDDVQWMDEPSRRLTLNLGWAIAQSPILLVLVHRSQDDPVLPDLNRTPHHHYIKLGELGPDGISSLLSHHLHGDLSPLALALVQALAQGNPFFALALLDTLRESGALIQQRDTWTLSGVIFDALRVGRCLARDNGGWTLAPDARLSALELDIPDTIHSAVLSRVDRLLEANKLTLKVASVVGHASALGLLAQSHPERPDLDVLLNQVKELETRDLVRQRTSRLGVLSCEFRSNIIQEVVYGTLLEEQRRELHRAVGDALQGLQPDAVEQLAYHYTRADVRDKALTFLDRAARKAQQEYANELALSYYSQALRLEGRWQWRKGQVEVLHILGRRDEELAALEALEADPQSLAFDVDYLRGQYYEAIGDYAKAQAAIREAAMDCWKRGDVVGQVRCLSQVGLIVRRQGDYDRAKTWYDRALGLIKDQQDCTAEEAQVLGEALNGLGVVYRQQGAFGEARGYYERALALSRECDSRLGEAKALNNLGSTALYRGEHAEATSYYEQALQIQREIGDRAGEGTCLYNLAFSAYELGRYGQAEAYFSEALGIHQATGNRWEEVNVLNGLGTLYQELGDLAAARSHLHRGLQLAQEIGDEAAEAYLLVNLGLVERDCGDLAEAERQLTAGLAIAQKEDDKRVMSSFLSYLGTVSLQAGQVELAVERAEMALALKQEFEMRLRAVDDLATLAAAHLTAGRQAKALHVVEQVLVTLDECKGAGPEVPQRDYYVCYQVLAAAGQVERAQAALQSACDLVMARAEKIVDPALSQSFLERVPINREILATAQQQAGAG